MKLNKYQQSLLKGWEEVFKKGQLTFWILLALKEEPKHMTEIKTFMSEMTGGALDADDRSIYRALRRYYSAELIDFTTRPGDSGPDLKVYHLTENGQSILEAFSSRNILKVFYKPKVRKLIEERKR